MFKKLRKQLGSFGPGLLYAGAAVGVSPVEQWRRSPHNRDVFETTITASAQAPAIWWPSPVQPTRVLG